MITWDADVNMWHVQYGERERWFASRRVAERWLADEECRSKAEAEEKP